MSPNESRGKGRSIDETPRLQHSQQTLDAVAFLRKLRNRLAVISSLGRPVTSEEMFKIREKTLAVLGGLGHG